MRFEFKPSFDRSIKSLQPEQKERAKTACFALLEHLDKQSTLPAGMGLKRLQDDFWEVRQDIRIRVIFRWRKDLLEFVLAGNHDEIRDFLKSL